MISTSSDLLPSDPVLREKLVQDAWRHAKDILYSRDQDARKVELDEMAAKLVEAERRGSEYKEKFDRLHYIISEAGRFPVAPPFAALSRIKDAIRALEGPVEGSRRIVHLPTTGLKKFIILGRLDGADAGREKAAILSFQFRDSESRNLPAPSWLRHSEKFGSYRYINPKCGNWFERAIYLPEGTAEVEIAIHDLRDEFLHEKAEVSPLILSEMTAVSIDLMEVENISDVGIPNSAIKSKKVPLIIDEHGAEALLELPNNAKSVQFEIEVSTIPGTESVLMVETHALSETKQTQRFEITVTTANARLSLSCQSPAPFNYVLLRLISREGDRPIILSDSQIRKLHSFPGMDLAKTLGSSQLPVSLLESLADDWVTREKWFGVYEDLSGPEAPLVAMRKVDDKTSPLALNFTVTGASRGGSTRKGMVLSLYAFDAEGHRLEIEGADYLSSEKFPLFKYIRVDEGLRHVLERLPAPEGARYFGVCLQGWHHNAFDHIGAAPLFCPVEDCARSFEEIHLRPSSLLSLPWHGVFAQKRSGALEILTPNYWQAPLEGDVVDGATKSRTATGNATAIRIRLGPDSGQSAWRDVAEGTWSPDIKALRDIVSTARRKRLPVILHLERMKDEAVLPYFLLPVADRVVIDETQRTRLITVVPENRLHVVQKENSQ
ncbi:MAG: hypothetical protein ACJASC_003451 [Limimaricola cinnabarinus]|jgi:hypothetical protein